MHLVVPAPQRPPSDSAEGQRLRTEKWARVWHASQEVRDQDDGSLVLTLQVCHDWALRSWILSFGPFARVLTPAVLVREVRADLQAANERYAAKRT